MRLTNNAEGGSNGVAVSVANSGGDSGNAWDSIVGTPTHVYDNTHTLGKMAYKLVGSTSAQQMVWGTSMGTQTSLWGRFYIWSSAAPTSVTGLFRWLSGAGQAARLRAETSGALTISDSGNAAEFTSTTLVTTLAAWCRVEWHIVFATTNATAELKIYTNPESTTAAETLSTTTAGGFTASADSIQFGTFNSTTWTSWVEDIEVNNTGYPGPEPRVKPGIRRNPLTQSMRRAALW